MNAPFFKKPEKDKKVRRYVAALHCCVSSPAFLAAI
jgi:hypothetical protein